VATTNEKTRQRSIRMGEAAFEALKRLARRTRRSKSFVVAELVVMADEKVERVSGGRQLRVLQDLGLGLKEDRT
jgi:predicted DNA-binding protein